MKNYLPFHWGPLIGRICSHRLLYTQPLLKGHSPVVQSIITAFRKAKIAFLSAIGLRKLLVKDSLSYSNHKMKFLHTNNINCSNFFFFLLNIVKSLCTTKVPHILLPKIGCVSMPNTFENLMSH